MQCCGHHKKPDKLYSFSLAHRRNVREALSEFVCKNMKNIEVKTNGDQIFFVTFQFSKNNATFWYSEWRVTKYYIDSFTAFTSTPPQVSKYRVFSDLCFPTFGMNTGGRLRISLYAVQVRENMDQKKLRIWTLFTQFQPL